MYIPCLCKNLRTPNMHLTLGVKARNICWYKFLTDRCTVKFTYKINVISCNARQDLNTKWTKEVLNVVWLLTQPFALVMTGPDNMQCLQNVVFTSCLT